MKRSEALRARAELIEQAEWRYREALGKALPDVSFNASQFNQDAGSGSDRESSNVTRRRRPEAKFTLRQPLFSGFREFAAMSAAEEGRAGEERRLDRAAARLYLDVAGAFYLAVGLDRDLANLEQARLLIEERAKELAEREQLGKSRRSERLSAESQRDDIEAERIAVAAGRAAAAELLSFLTGEDLSAASFRDEPGPDGPAGEPAGLEAAAAARSDLDALRRDVEARRQELKLARGAFYPSAGFTGNYYTKRVGSQRDIDWDALFSVEVPLFQGGVARAGVGAARSRLREAELALAEAERRARAEAREALLRLNASVEQAARLRSAFEKADESYRLQAREYRLGLVNNLEVLQAMNDRQSRRRALDRALVDARLRRAELDVAVDRVPGLPRAAERKSP